MTNENTTTANETGATSNVAPSIRSHGEAFGIADNAAAKHYGKVFVGMKSDAIDPSDIEGKGQYYADFRDGLLIGWQGADFFTAYSTAKGKEKLKGKKLGKQNTMVSTTLTKTEWQQQLASKVSKARKMYAEHLEEGDNAKGERAAPTELLAKIAKDCAAWKDRLELIRTGKPKPSDKGIEADVSSLIAPMQAMIDLAKSLDK